MRLKTTMERPAVRVPPLAGLLVASLAVASCSDGLGPRRGSLSTGDLECSIPRDMIFPGGPGKDGIPALTDPKTVLPHDPEAGYLLDDDRIIGVEAGNETLAIPLNVMWWHEIVNLNLGDTQLAVTHCPLTGSTLAFDRSAADGAEFGVSGLLYLNNLVMYDRSSVESLWPQMLRGARCGPRDGTSLSMYPVVEMRWDRWVRLYPETRVVSGETSHDRDYTRYPYGSYDDPDNSSTLFPQPALDPRRPPKERVLGIPAERGGVAYPFGALDELGATAIVEDTVGARPVVVLWSREGRAAMAFEPMVNGRSLTLELVGDTIRDRETGTVWAEDGSAIRGPLEGERLEAVGDAFVAFWFAWAEFYPDARLWGDPS